MNKSIEYGNPEVTEEIIKRQLVKWMRMGVKHNDLLLYLSEMKRSRVWSIEVNYVLKDDVRSEESEELMFEHAVDVIRRIGFDPKKYPGLIDSAMGDSLQFAIKEEKNREEGL